MGFSRHILFIVLVPAILAAGYFSYDRFMVKHDYMVTYERDCDPATESCYIGCEDDECTEEYYYSLIEKYAADVYGECGPDITDCEAASVCLDEERSCTITYCDLEAGEECAVHVPEEGALEEPANEEVEPLEELDT